MNRKFKVGDIVVLEDGRYLSTLGMILAEKKHLFEVESVEYDRADLKSTSTGLKTTVYEGNLRHATLKERFLRTGNSIVYDGKGYLVLGNKLIGLKGGFDTDYFCDDLLTVSDRRPITKVFNTPYWKFENKIDVNYKYATVLWERKPKIELTSDEVVILRNIDKKYKYLARDGYDDRILVAYEEEPIKSDDNDEYVAGDDSEVWEYLTLFNHLFQDITFESGAHLIDDLIRDNENENYS